MKRTFNSSEKKEIVETGKKTTTEKHGWKWKGGPLYEIEEEEEHVYIIVNGIRYELFEGEFCWYYIDEHGDKHYIAFERKWEWVGKGTKEYESKLDERWVAMTEEEKWIEIEERKEAKRLLSSQKGKYGGAIGGTLVKGNEAKGLTIEEWDAMKTGKGITVVEFDHSGYNVPGY